MQETRLMENEYSVNLPTRFYYKKRWNNGFVNIVNISVPAWLSGHRAAANPMR